jgi:hypothetical protein
MKAIQTTGKIDAEGQLSLDSPIKGILSRSVRVIIFVEETEIEGESPEEIDEDEWLHAAANNPVFDFLKDPEEDIYTLADGKPFND